MPRDTPDFELPVIPAEPDSCLPQVSDSAVPPEGVFQPPSFDQVVEAPSKAKGGPKSATEFVDGLADYEGSLFVDEGVYYVAKLKIGDNTIFIRDLDDQVLIDLQNFGETLSAATDGRLPAHMVAELLTSGGTQQGLSDETVAVLKDLSVNDQDAVRQTVNSLIDRLLVAGISGWEVKGGRECSEDAKKKLGPVIKGACLAKIMEVSGFSSEDQRFPQ